MNVIRFAQSECKTIKSYMDSYLNDELLVETNHEVLKHLASCKDCAVELEGRLRLKNALQTAVRKDVAPIGLQQRIQRDIRKPKSGYDYQWRTWMIAAAAMLVLTMGGWGVFRAIKPGEKSAFEVAKQQDAEVLNIGLTNHLHCAVDRQFADKHFTDEEMTTKLGAEFIGLVSLMKEKVQGNYEIVVGHRCHLKQREYVHLILKNQDKVMSLVLTKKNGEAFSKATLGNVLMASGVPLHASLMQNYEVTGFETRDYLAFLVSNLQKQESDAIAANIAPAVRDYLARMES
jgi:hypothetical protein